MFYQSVLILCVASIASTEGIVMRDGHPNRNGQCSELRCNQAAGIADRLSKLSLLPEFVTQTLLLLEDLMKEMENELQRSANFLMDQIEPSCESTAEIIQQILMKKLKKSGRQEELGMGIEQELGMGIEPFTSEREYNHDTASAQDTIYKRDRQDSRDESNWSPVESDKQWSSDVFNSQRTHGTEEQWSKPTRINQWSQESDNTNYQQNSNQRPKSHSHYGYHDKDQSQFSESSFLSQTGKEKFEGSKKKYGRKFKQDRKNSRVFKKTEPITSTPQEHVCRGIDDHSPFWVPGLDQWCQQNCGAGYCPETHCIC